MPTLSELYILFGVFGGLLPVAFLRPALANRDKPGATGLLFCILAAVVYALAISIRSLGFSSTELFIVQSIVMLGGVLGAVGWFLLFAEYTGLVQSTRRAVYGLVGFIVLMQLVIWTNPLHHLFYDPIPQLTGDTSENRRVLFWVFTAIMYGMVLVATGSIIRDILRSQGIRRRQAIYLLGGSIPPVVTIGISGTAKLVPVDITPLGFVAGTAVLTWAMFRGEFLEIVSVGRTQVIESTTDPFVTLDQKNRVVDTNPKAREVFDVSEGWDGTPVAEFFGPYTDLIEELASSENSNTEISIEQDASQYHFDVEKTPIYGPQGERRGQVIVFRDVTELKTREQKLQRLTKRYDLALDGTDTGVWELNVEKDAIEFDERMKTLYGYSPDETIRNYDQVLEAVHPEDRERVSDAYQRGLEEGGYETEFRVHPDGESQRWLWVRAEAQYENGEPVRFVGIGQNITERKERERKLRQKNELLDEFASVVSHDVATPLGVIENKARLIEMTGETTHAGEIYEASERIQKLIDELRHLGQEGEEIGETEPVELQRVTREAWDSIAAPSAELTVNNSKPVDADRVRLRQLLENLLENSVEHGAVSLNSFDRTDPVEQVSTETTQPSEESEPRADSDSSRARTLSVTVGTLPNGFYVEDDGTGVPESERERIFDQGYTTVDEGAGLGLAIVSSVVDGHGWTIDVTDSEDGGARFEIRTDRSSAT